MRQIPAAVLIVVSLLSVALAHGERKKHASITPGRRAVQSTESPHPSAGAGPTHKLEFENDSVRVLRIRIGPHEKIPMHEVSPRVVVWLTDVHLRDTLASGKIQEEHRKAGEVSWVSAQRHRGENLSDRPIEFVAIVPKASEPSAGPHTGGARHANNDDMDTIHRMLARTDKIRRTIRELPNGVEAVTESTDPAMTARSAGD